MAADFPSAIQVGASAVSPSVAAGLAITVLTLAALFAPVAAERRIAAMVHSRRVAAAVPGGKSTGGAVAVARCPVTSCGARGYHRFIRRVGNAIRRECRSCGVQWTELL